jgi:hypothetical protein
MLRIAHTVLISLILATPALADGDKVADAPGAKSGLPAPQSSVVVTMERGVRVWRPVGLPAQMGPMPAAYPQQANYTESTAAQAAPSPNYGYGYGGSGGLYSGGNGTNGNSGAPIFYGVGDPRHTGQVAGKPMPASGKPKGSKGDVHVHAHGQGPAYGGPGAYPPGNKPPMGWNPPRGSKPQAGGNPPGRPSMGWNPPRGPMPYAGGHASHPPVKHAAAAPRAQGHPGGGKRHGGHR